MKQELMSMLRQGCRERWGYFMSLDMAASLWYKESALTVKPGTRNTYITAYMYMASDAMGGRQIRWSFSMSQIL